MMDRQKLLEGARRIVIKVGTSSITYDTGKLNLARIERLVRQVADLANQGKSMVLVSSGAVGAGMGRLGFTERPKTMPEKQATAAVGQGILMHTYEKMFSEYGHTVAQVLLTRDDSMDRRRYLNSRNALMTLLDFGAIPIINENDAVAVDELKFGDNDTLSAMVAGLVDADLLIILSDIDGLFTDNPQTNPEAKLIDVVEEITQDIEALAKGAGTKHGTGGMYTKIQAGKIAVNSGAAMVIANSSRDGILNEILSGKPAGSLFLPKHHKLHSRKRWIAFGAKTRGKLIVDTGAVRAVVTEGSSLLSTGVHAVEGCFAIGNTVSIIAPDGQEVARGIVNYNSEEIGKILGRHSDEIGAILGAKPYDELIHRDNLVVLG